VAGFGQFQVCFTVQFPLLSQFEFHFHHVVVVELSQFFNWLSRSDSKPLSHNAQASVPVLQRVDFGLISASFSSGVRVDVVVVEVELVVVVVVVDPAHREVHPHAIGIVLFKGEESSLKAEDMLFWSQAKISQNSSEVSFSVHPYWISSENMTQLIFFRSSIISYQEFSLFQSVYNHDTEIADIDFSLVFISHSLRLYHLTIRFLISNSLSMLNLSSQALSLCDRWLKTCATFQSSLIQSSSHLVKSLPVSR
jgi:hypothetical protein